MTSAIDTPDARWRVVHLPLTAYREALGLQLRIVAARTEGRLPFDVVLLLEHPAVFTLGRRGGRENLTVSESFLSRSAVDLVQTERGGNITYHGPGQLVAYPIVDLEAGRIRVVDFVHGLEEVMIRTAARWQVTAGRRDLNRGVWVGERKLGSVGICVRRGVSFHGLALNVDLDLAPFGWINPCGLAGVCMTSIARETGRGVSVAKTRGFVAEAFAQVFAVETAALAADELDRLLGPDTRSCGVYGRPASKPE